MDIHVHLGAHRTGTTTFQGYLRAERAALTARRVGFWGPWRLRSAALARLLDHGAERAEGHLQQMLRGTKQRGVEALLLTEENFLGSIRQNVSAGRLYPDAGTRVARLAHALGAPCHLHLQIRALDGWWASALRYAVARGSAVPGPEALTRIAFAPRRWRHVITELAAACPGTPVTVSTFEAFGGAPSALLAAMLRRDVPQAYGVARCNVSPTLPALRLERHLRGDDPAALPPGMGLWQPFDAIQTSALQEAYAEDLYWLQNGAGGLARFCRPTTDMAHMPRMTTRGQSR